MFQSSDDVDFDQELLSDLFDTVPTESIEECNKRNLKSSDNASVKKLCIGVALAESKCNAANIISAIRHKPNRGIFKPPDIKHRIVQRKFPGPAGILSSVHKPAVDEIVCSQSTEDVFEKGPWLQMLADISEKLYNKYTIEWAKLCSASNTLIDQRTPFLAAIVQSVNCSSKNPLIVLKDRTGDIRATLIQEVWDQYQDLLHSGSVIVLKQIGVLSISKRSYKRLHLTVTLNNLITIYSNNESSDSQVVRIQDLSSEELIRSIEDVKKNHCPRNQKRQFNTNNPWLTTIPSPNRLLTNNTLSSTINTPTVHSQEDEILSQVLDGLDAESLFEDF